MTLSRKSRAKLKQSGPPSVIEHAIHTVRGERVILDADLAQIYGVETRVLNQAGRRNREKFPSGFFFQPTGIESIALNRSQVVTMRSQTVIASKGNVRHLPYAFTAHGAIMAANILNSPEVVQMSVFVVRAFIKMRSAFTDTRELARKLASLEKELKSRLHTHESSIVEVLQQVMALLDPPPPPPPEMGFHTTSQLASSTE